MHKIISGEGSIVKITNTAENLIEKININCGKNCRIEINGIKIINNVLGIYMADNTSLIIGKDQLINGHVSIMMHEPSEIEIGDSCLWANCKIWTSDMHSIIDRDSRKRINRASNISIEGRVWIGEDSLILKGSKVLEGCVIGARSVITKSTPSEPHCVLSGNPARVTRRNIDWDWRLM